MALAAPASDASPAPRPAHAKPTPSPLGGEVMLGAHYAISTKDTVPAMSTAQASAYRAFDRRFTADSFVALICSGNVLPRLDAMAALRSFSRAGMLTLKEFGPVDWVDGKQRLAVIYSSAGGRYALATPHQPWQIVEALLRPAAAALGEIHNHGTTHRAIRPDNLFLREAGAAALTLGPCVATPPGYDQPEIYEPLETAPADPAGRGNGGPKYDLFALGMTAVALLLGRQPGNEFDRDELMIRRMEMGSLAAVMPLHSIPREIIDALSGLTADDEDDRWTLADLQKWLNAGRPDQPRHSAPPRVVMPYEIGGKQVRSARSLAYMLGRNWTQAVAHLREDGGAARWLRDYAPERMAAARLDQALLEREPEAEAADSDALQVCRAIMALDPEGPIRFRGSAVDPSGLGSWLFDAIAAPDRRTTAAALLRYSLPQKALDRRMSVRRVDRRRAQRQAINYERLRRWALSDQPGEGLERCLYDLNVNLPCLSPMAGGRWVTTVGELIRSLDDAAASGRVTEPTLDAHVAAYIATRFDASGEALLTLMKPKDADDDARMGAIRLFAELQQSFGGMPLPGIAGWCATLARRVAENFHHRPTRKQMLDVIDRALPAGNVATILKAIDLPGLKVRDHQAFAGARREWMRLQLETTSIERNADSRRERARARGRENAAFVSGAGSLLAMVVTLFLDSPR